MQKSSYTELINKELEFEDPWYRYERIIKTLDKNFQKDISQAKSWLDIGCHNLSLLEIVSKYYELPVTGIDIWNSQEKGASHSHIDYIQRNLLNQDWSQKNIGKKFSVISGLEVIEHVINTDEFIQNCYDLLEDNGLLIISTPNINSLRNRITTPLGIYPTGLEYRTIIHHVRLYNPSVLQKHLKEYGFKIEKVMGVNFLPVSILSKTKNVDISLSNSFPNLCGNFIVIARKIS